MSTRIPVSPGRLHCDFCKAEPGEPCWAMSVDPVTGANYQVSPQRAITGYHSIRKHKAKHGVV